MVHTAATQIIIIYSNYTVQYRYVKSAYRDDEQIKRRKVPFQGESGDRARFLEAFFIYNTVEVLK